MTTQATVERTSYGLRPYEVLGVVALFALGTVNLVKAPAVQELVPVDLTSAAAVSVAWLAAARLLQRPRSLLEVPVVLLFAVCLLSGVVTSSFNPYSLTKITGLLIALLLLAAPAVLLRSERQLALIPTCCVISGVIAAFLLLAFGDEISGRDTLEGLNPIGVSRFVGLACVVLSVFLVRHRQRRPLWWLGSIAACAVCLAAMVSTGSRGPLVSVGVGFAVALGAMVRRKGTSRLVVVGVIVVVAVAWATLELAAPQARSRLESDDASGRSRLLTESLRLVSHHPMGIGWGDLVDYVPGIINYEGSALYPHNLLVEITLEGGWIAGAAFVLICSLALRGYLRLARCAQTWAWSLLAVYVYSVSNAMFSSDAVGNRMAWLFIGIGLALNAPRSDITGAGSARAGSEDSTAEGVELRAALTGAVSRQRTDQLPVSPGRAPRSRS